jgi:formylglycine-generating enzyme required for sulfatase activity
MSGNVWDWCLSAWREDYSAAENNQTKPATQPRVLRGGSFLDSPELTQAANRISDDPIFGNVNIGFRLVCMAPPPDEN